MRQKTIIEFVHKYRVRKAKLECNKGFPAILASRDHDDYGVIAFTPSE